MFPGKRLNESIAEFCFCLQHDVNQSKDKKQRKITMRNKPKLEQTRTGIQAPFED